MTLTARQVAALAVFKDLGWDEADPAAAERLPLGTAAQQRTARIGLSTGEWGRFGPIGDRGHGGWISWIDVDRDLLGLFAVRAGVDARRAARILPWGGDADKDVVARIVAERGPAFAGRFIEHACTSRRRWSEHGPSVYGSLAVWLVARHGLPVPQNVEYLKDWAVHALAALTDDAGEPPVIEWPARVAELVEARFAEHARAAVAVGVPATGPFGTVLPAGVERGWIERDEAVELAFAGLDAAGRPGDRKVWIQVLTRDLSVGEAELIARADALIPLLGFGDAPVVAAAGPALIAGVDDDRLAEVLPVALTVRTATVRRALLRSAADRPLPAAATRTAVAPAIVPLVDANDRSLARAARALVDAWGLAPTEEPTPTGPAARGWWQPTPDVWQVPRFDPGEVCAQALTAAAAELTGRPDGVLDVATERFLALANAVAGEDADTARAALAGVRDSWISGLRPVPAWCAGEPGRLLDRPAPSALEPGEPGRGPTLEGVLTAREAHVFARLGQVPSLLSTPTWVDLRIDPADLLARLGRYATTGAAASEGDLLLALLRLELSLVTDDILAGLAELDVPVLLQSGEPMSVSAGAAVRAYARDPLREPALRLRPGWRYWRADALDVPASLAAFPPRLGVGGRGHAPGLACVPAWGDGAGDRVAYSDYPTPEAGLQLRQQARRATPLTPGLAVNMVGAQRSLHRRAASDGAAAVIEAWERGLLRPGVADVRLLDWNETPSNLASLAAACRELAEDGLASVVWPILDGLIATSLRAPRLSAGTAELVEAVEALLPEAKAAVDLQIASPDALDLPGVRALAAHGGSSRAVRVARAVVAQLPEPTPAPATAAPPPAEPTGPPLADIWPVHAGTTATIEDGARIEAHWADPSAPTKRLALDIELPGGRRFRVDKDDWFYELEREGQCAAQAFVDGRPPRPGRGRRDAWLRWDARRGQLVVSEHRNWAEGKPGPLQRGTPIPPLTTSMVAVALAALCSDATPTYAVRAMIGMEKFGAGAVRVAIRALLPHPDVSPARMMLILEREPTTLATLWPLLTESVRFAGERGGPLPRWINRVLDTALLYADALAEAGRTGRIPEESARWPGLATLAERPGTSAAVAKAQRLRGRLEA